MMPAKRRTPVRLDARDLRILDIIQRNGRISKKALAEAIGVSLTPCFQRLQRLEREGFIRGYRGVVETRRFGSFVWVYTHVTLVRHRAADFQRFESVVQGLPEVIECDVVSGGVDYVLKFIARDVAHYQRLIEDLIARDIGISVYISYIITKRVKESASIPVAQLTAQAS
jgi:Lrp/AsnC family transcriptional regulator, regulator of ectoine-degradation genes